MRTSARSVALAVALLAIGAAPAAAAPIDDVVDADLEFARDQLAATAAAVPPGRYPSRTGPSGIWETTGPREWTSGFYPGSLWLGFEGTGDPLLRSQAEARLAGLRGQRRDKTGNDQGFKLLPTFGRGYEITGRDEYRRVAVLGARSLASRFDPVVGATRSWGMKDSPKFTVIVDNLMNLELLFWAAEHGGDPAWFGMARSHALRTASAHVRGDGSTFHVVEFHPRTGAVKRKRTQQGYTRGSTWSRGQAWAIHGFTMAYRETGEPRLLAAARRTAAWFLGHLPPDDVPYWDFNDPDIPNAPRDSSAAAIAASGLLELAELEPDAAAGAGYRAAAEQIIASLSGPAYLARGTASQAILLHGTQDLPRGSFDTGIGFGDYYFIEGLLRHRTPPAPGPAPELEIQPTGNPLRARVTASESGTVRAALLAGRPLARRLDLHSAKKAVLGRAEADIGGTGSATLRIRPRRSVRAQIRDRDHLAATLSAALDGADGRSTARAVELPR